MKPLFESSPNLQQSYSWLTTPLFSYPSSPNFIPSTLASQRVQHSLLCDSNRPVMVRRHTCCGPCCNITPPPPTPTSEWVFFFAKVEKKMVETRSQVKTRGGSVAKFPLSPQHVQPGAPRKWELSFSSLSLFPPSLLSSSSCHAVKWWHAMQ